MPLTEAQRKARQRKRARKRRRMRMHERKHSYVNRIDAERELPFISRALGDPLLHCYECEFCGHWHIGHIRR